MAPVLDSVDVTPFGVPSPTATYAKPPQGFFEYSYCAVARHDRWVWKRGKTSRGKPLFTVADAATGVFGAGADPNAAIQDLLRARREHREVLEGQPKLSPSLKAQLKHLQR